MDDFATSWADTAPGSHLIEIVFCRLRDTDTERAMLGDKFEEARKRRDGFCIFEMMWVKQRNQIANDDTQSQATVQNDVAQVFFWKTVPGAAADDKQVVWLQTWLV